MQIKKLNELKVNKILFVRQIFIIYMHESIAVDSFFGKIREILKLQIKWTQSNGLTAKVLTK